MRVLTALANASKVDLDIAERYRGLAFAWREWSRPHHNRDHDHCLFCKACICDSGQPGHYKTAFMLRYETDSPVWVCRSCFKIVRASLDWKIVRQTP